jgi:UDP-N-acetylglucosamine 2-epimerase
MGEEDVGEVLQVFDCGLVYSQDGYKNWQEAINDALMHAASYQGKRERCFNSIFGYRDRNAGSRVAEIIAKNILHEKGL